jgi:menaquinone-dependent protoporphyrinogen oxidase
LQILVTYGSKDGGAEVVAQVIVRALRDAGHTAAGLPCSEAGPVLAAFDAVLVGGSLRDGHWPLGSRWFVWRRAAQLRRAPVWFFSDAAPGGSADREAPPTASVRSLMVLAAARGHATFCSRQLSEGRARASTWARRVALDLAPAPVPGAEVGQP